MGSEFFAVLLLYLFSPIRAQLPSSETYDYCDPKLKLCETPTDHTMCKYPNPGLSSQCTPAVHEPLSATEKKRILFWHNKFRSIVASGSEINIERKLPKASNMRQIYWDRELEGIAARWAEQCASTTSKNVYDTCRNTKRFQVSQNVGTRQVNASSIEKQAPMITFTWYKESKDFDPTLVDKYTQKGEDNQSTRQYANVIWAETFAIGCARVIFQENLPISGKDTGKTSVWTIERLVCNYGPGGNKIGKPIYKRGASCENCPNGTQCSAVFPGLCAMQSAEKSESQQNLESQETKEETSTEQEMSTTTTNLTSKSSVAETEHSIEFNQTEETILDDQEEKLLSSQEMFSDDLVDQTAKTEKKERTEQTEITEKTESTPTTTATTDCEGDSCYEEMLDDEPVSTTDYDYRLHEIIKSPKPPDHKAPPGFEKIFLRNQRSPEVSSNSQKANASQGSKTLKEILLKTQNKELKEGDNCLCYVLLETLEDFSRSSNLRPHFLVFFSIGFIMIYKILFCKSLL